MQEKINNFINTLKNKKIHIVGISSSEGLSVAFFLCKYGINTQNIIAHDFSDTEEDFIKSFNTNHVAFSKDKRDERLIALKKLNLKINYSKDYLKEIKNADVIFVSQNWFNYSCNFPALKEANDNKIPFINITGLYFMLTPCPIIAVTGSNGKTTASNLIYEIIKCSQKRVFFTGNDRYAKQLLEGIDTISRDDLLVMEISNRQLINFKDHPHIGVITNVLPNHIDEHGSFENYIKIKFNLFENQTTEDFAVINYDNSITKGFLQNIKSQPFCFSRKVVFGDNGVYEKDGKIFAISKGKIHEICMTEDILLPGEHNIENVLAAVAATFLAGINTDKIKEGIKNFKGIKNRMELIRTVNEVSYYNDLSSTTPQATVAALRSLKDNIILIAGGHDKGMDYDELVHEIKNRVKKLILLPGHGTDKIIQNLNGFNFTLVATLQEGIELANNEVRAGNKVLLSPACASFYSLYVSDQDGFNKIVKKIKRIKIY